MIGWILAEKNEPSHNNWSELPKANSVVFVKQNTIAIKTTFKKLLFVIVNTNHHLAGKTVFSLAASGERYSLVINQLSAASSAEMTRSEKQL